MGLGEHDAIINGAAQLAQQGYDVVYAPINADGSVNVEEFKNLLTPNVALVSIMHVSNETGAINDVARLCKLTKKIAPNAVFTVTVCRLSAKSKSIFALSALICTRFPHTKFTDRKVSVRFTSKRHAYQTAYLRWRTGKRVPLGDGKRTVYTRLCKSG